VPIRIDRIQVAVPDRAEAARGWVELLGAEADGRDEIAALGARRTRYRLGDGFVELLEPSGAGVVQEALAQHGPHLFAAGVATPDLDGLRARLRELGAAPAHEGGQLHLSPGVTGGHGLRVVVSADQPLPPVGATQGLYEVTNLVRDSAAAVQRVADLFALDANAFVPIASSEYGYDGTLTLFDPDRLDRLEMITPRAPEKTMGRFFARRGECLYMAFAECRDLAEIERRATHAGVGHTVVPPAAKRGAAGPDTIFLHPDALGGMMLGLSRPSVAWTWSGRPDRVESAR